LETLLQMNDVVNVKTDTDDEEEMGKGLHETLSLGLDSLMEMRQKEGTAIETDGLKWMRIALRRKWLFLRNGPTSRKSWFEWGATLNSSPHTWKWTTWWAEDSISSFRK